MVTHFVMPWKNPKTGEIFDIYKSLVDYYQELWVNVESQTEKWKIIGTYWWNASVRIFLRQFGLPFNNACKRLFRKEFLDWSDIKDEKEKKQLETLLRSWFEISKWYESTNKQMHVFAYEHFEQQFFFLKKFQSFQSVGARLGYFEFLLKKPKYASMQLTHYLELPLEKWIGPEFIGLCRREIFPPKQELLTSWSIRNKQYRRWARDSEEDGE